MAGPPRRHGQPARRRLRRGPHSPRRPSTPPAVTPGEAYPDGVTVEFVVPHTPRHLALRVHERGVGETSACGTGACAAVTALRQRERHAGAGTYTVDVPGGRLHVTVHDDGTMILGGPAVIVADGMVWLTPDAITARSRQFARAVRVRRLRRYVRP